MVPLCVPERLQVLSKAGDTYDNFAHLRRPCRSPALRHNADFGGCSSRISTGTGSARKRSLRSLTHRFRPDSLRSSRCIDKRQGYTPRNCTEMMWNCTVDVPRKLVYKQPKPTESIQVKEILCQGRAPLHRKSAVTFHQPLVRLN